MIKIDYRDARPIYEQIVDGVETLALRGALPSGSQLPSVRQLAMELSINPNTIQRAYAELERRGVIYAAKGRGNFISDDTAALRKRRLEEIGVHRCMLWQIRRARLAQRKSRYANGWSRKEMVRHDYSGKCNQAI